MLNRALSFGQPTFSDQTLCHAHFRERYDLVLDLGSLARLETQREVEPVTLRSGRYHTVSPLELPWRCLSAAPEALIVDRHESISYLESGNLESFETRLLIATPRNSKSPVIIPGRRSCQYRGSAAGRSCSTPSSVRRLVDPVRRAASARDSDGSNQSTRRSFRRLASSRGTRWG